jgi:hypothetical protein
VKLNGFSLELFNQGSNDPKDPQAETIPQGHAAMTRFYNIGFCPVLQLRKAKHVVAAKTAVKKWKGTIEVRILHTRG